jgi:hypothetical protein
MMANGEGFEGTTSREPGTKFRSPRRRTAQGLSPFTCFFLLENQVDTMIVGAML